MFSTEFPESVFTRRIPVRKIQMLWRTIFCVLLVPVMMCPAAHSDAQAPFSDRPSYSYATSGVLENVRGALGTKWKLLLNQSNLGGKELEAAEVTLPAATVVGAHTHSALEVIYVLSGTYGHEVNGKLFWLKPGQIGIVRPGDKVRHLASRDAAAKLLIVWVPAGEADRLFGSAFRQGTGVTPEPVPEAPAQSH
jgi:quercetin dioxygenase-like cupin family protein